MRESGPRRAGWAGRCLRARLWGMQRHRGVALPPPRPGKSLKHRDQNSFADRRRHAAEAKKILLKKFKSAPSADDPQRQARAAERQRIAEQRAARQEERERERAAAAEAERVEAEAREAAQAAERLAEAERLVREEAERKAERDRRYAARKARRK